MKKVIQEYPHNARKVIDTKTNVVYDSLKEAAIANNLSSPRLYYRIKSGCTKSSLAYL